MALALDNLRWLICHYAKSIYNTMHTTPIHPVSINFFRSTLLDLDLPQGLEEIGSNEFLHCHVYSRQVGRELEFSFLTSCLIVIESLETPDCRNIYQ